MRKSLMFGDNQNESKNNEDIRPAEETFQKLIDYKIATIKNNKYVYAPEFEETVAEIRRNPPGKREQFHHGRQARKVIKTLILYIKSFSRSRHNIENLIFAYTILCLHLERLNMEWPDKDDEPFIVYATWYLNDHEPEVFSEGQDETP